MLQYFRSSFLVTFLGLVGAWLIAGWGGLWIAFNLALLETSLSFDNAVVNASVLKHWDEKWRKRFLLWGIRNLSVIVRKNTQLYVKIRISTHFNFRKFIFF